MKGKGLRWGAICIVFISWELEKAIGRIVRMVIKIRHLACYLRAWQFSADVLGALY